MGLSLPAPMRPGAVRRVADGRSRRATPSGAGAAAGGDRQRRRPPRRYGYIIRTSSRTDQPPMDRWRDGAALMTPALMTLALMTSPTRSVMTLSGATPRRTEVASAAARLRSSAAGGPAIIGRVTGRYCSDAVCRSRPQPSSPPHEAVIGFRRRRPPPAAHGRSAVSDG